ncbi:TRAP transporter small permease [Elioraea sp.]|uniref:TRAP transporter small permease n=1 Tax=Elioraea sp. TaxID=2185103 RepID=UPI0025C4B1D7|nr:TRAP transporter small permease [Elioraea sp.]
MLDDTVPTERSGAPKPGAYARFNRLLTWLLCLFVTLAVGILVLPVSLQIFSRFTAILPHYIWTEEMARFLLVWMIMLGAMLGVREGNHFVVDIWPVLAPRPKAALDLFADLCMLLFAVVLIWWGWEFTEFAWWRVSELAELPLWLIHVAWPASGVVWTLFLGQRIRRDIRILIAGRDLGEDIGERPMSSGQL